MMLLYLLLGGGGGGHEGADSRVGHGAHGNEDRISINDPVAREEAVYGQLEGERQSFSHKREIIIYRQWIVKNVGIRNSQKRGCEQVYLDCTEKNSYEDNRLLRKMVRKIR
jgi:hypothetical protein